MLGAPQSNEVKRMRSALSHSICMMTCASPYGKCAHFKLGILTGKFDFYDGMYLEDVDLACRKPLGG